MKIIVVSGTSGSEMSAQPGADSAILRPGEPVFLPEDVTGWKYFAATAIRMCRLGTNIPVSKAPAYFDAIAAFLLMIPEENDCRVPWTLRDRAFSPGSFISIPETSFELAAGVRELTTRKTAEETVFKRSVDPEAMEIPATVARLSRYCTFKTGDIIIFRDFGLDLGCPVVDTGVQVFLGSEKSLDVRLK